MIREIDVMSKSVREDSYNIVAFDSPFEGNMGLSMELNEELKLLRRNIDIMLETFMSGMDTSEDGLAALKYLNENEAAYEGYKRLCVNGYINEFPSVDDLMEFGNKIIIVNSDGEMTTFTKKYFEGSKTVEKLMEQEKADSAKDMEEGRGSVMATFITVYLVGANNYLRNYEKVFGDSGVGTASVYMCDGRKNAVTVTSKKSLAMYNKYIEESPEVNKVIVDLSRAFAVTKMAQAVYRQYIQSRKKIIQAEHWFGVAE